MNKARKLFDDILEDETKHKAIAESINTLEASRVIELLRIIGRGAMYPTSDSQSFQAVQAYNAAFSAGYNSALDDIENFVTKYCTKTEPYKPKPTFTKVELDDLELN